MKGTLALLSLGCLASLSYLGNTSLVFASLRFVERNAPKELLLMIFWLIHVVSAKSCQFRRALWFLLDGATATDRGLVFAIGLDYCYSDNKDWNCPLKN